MNKQHKTHAALALAFALITPAAHAGAQSSATINQVTFTLADLTPTDGLAAYYQLPGLIQDEAIRSITWTEVEDWGWSKDPVFDARSMPAMFSALSSHGSLPQGSVADASIDGSQIMRASVLAQGHDGRETRVTAVAGVRAVAPSDGEGGFGSLILSPRSSLTITVRGELSADASNPLGAYCYVQQCISEEASASIWLETFYPSMVYGSPNHDQKYTLITASAGDLWTYNPTTFSEDHSQFFSGKKSQSVETFATIVNDSDQVLRAYFGVGATAFARGSTIMTSSPSVPAPSVPEPGAWVLFMVGAGLLMFGSRRARAIQA